MTIRSKNISPAKLTMVLLLFLAICILLSGCNIGRDVREPVIKEKEFPIYFKYTVDQLEDSNPIVIEDVYECSYIGITDFLIPVITGYRSWRGDFKNGYWINNRQIVLFSNGKLTISYCLGSPGYYMDNDNSYQRSDPYWSVRRTLESGERTSENVEHPDQLKQYGVTIIDYTVPEPIENTFKDNIFAEYYN